MWFYCGEVLFECGFVVYLFGFIGVKYFVEQDCELIGCLCQKFGLECEVFGFGVDVLWCWCCCGGVVCDEVVVIWFGVVDFVEDGDYVCGVVFVFLEVFFLFVEMGFVGYQFGDFF